MNGLHHYLMGFGVNIMKLVMLRMIVVVAVGIVVRKLMWSNNFGGVVRYVRYRYSPSPHTHIVKGGRRSTMGIPTSQSKSQIN